MSDVGNCSYPMVRGSGAFLVCVGLGLILAVIWGEGAPVNMRILAYSAIIGIAAISGRLELMSGSSFRKAMSSSTTTTTPSAAGTRPRG